MKWNKCFHRDKRDAHTVIIIIVIIIAVFHSVFNCQTIGPSFIEVIG